MENNIIIFSDTEYIKKIQIEKDNEIANKKKILDDLEDKINQLEIKSQPDFDNSTDLLKAIKVNIKNIEKKRKMKVRPIGNEAVDLVIPMAEIVDFGKNKNKLRWGDNYPKF